MSWIFAVANKYEDARRSNAYCHPTPLRSISTPHLFLAAGGNPDTTFWDSDAESSAGWAVVGIGIMNSGSRSHIMNRDDWSRLLKRNPIDTTVVDGHFFALRWNQSRTECFTDQLGLRTAYFAKCAEGVCISSRLDWVARTTHHSEIDLGSLGSRWLLFNQMSNESCIAGIECLGPGGRVTFEHGSPVHFEAYHPWLPAFESGPTQAAVDVLKGLVLCALTNNHRPSLGLSGGLDSRLLLALLSEHSTSDITTHTFGDPGDPDVKIAKQLTAATGIRNHHFDDPIPHEAVCSVDIRSFAAQLNLTEPFTSYLKLRYYSRLHEADRLMIDGGFGEIARRQYLNRVVTLGKSALARHDAKRLLPLLRANRADFFTQDVHSLFEQGACRTLEKTLAEMPSLATLGVENFADLLAVRTRVPNFGAPEQARLDGEVLNFMPLVQPSFLRAVFRVSPRRRSSGRFYHSTIRATNPTLSRFPLVKSGFTYPFGLSPSMAWLTVTLKSQLSRGYVDAKPIVLLHQLREYVLDLVHSQAVTTNSLYDSQRLKDQVVKYYQGEIRFKKTVEWWLTFHMWAESLSE